MKRVMRFVSQLSQWIRHSGEIVLGKHAMFVAYHPKSVLGIIGMLTLIAALGMTRLTVRNNYEADLPADDAVVQSDAEAEQMSGKEDTITVAIVCEDGDIFTSDRIATLHAVEDDCRRIPGFRRMTSPGSTPTLTGHWEESAGEREWILTNEPLLASCPATDAERTLRRQQSRRSRTFYGKLISPNFTAVQIIVEVERSYELQRPINEAAAQLKRTHTKNGIRIYTTGGPILNHETDIGIERQVQLYFAVSLIVMVAGIHLAFRSIVCDIIFILMTSTGMLWTMGVIGWSGRPLNVVTSAIPVLLSAIAASYAVRLFTAWQRTSLAQDNAPKIAIAMLTSVGDDIVKTAVTASFGSATLITFLLAMIREYGLFFAVGCIAEMVLALTLAPAILAFLTPKQKQRGAQSVSIGLKLQPIGRFAVDKPWGVVAIWGVVLLFAVIGITKLEVGVSWREFFPRNHEVPKTADVSNEKFGWSYSCIVVVDTNREGGVHDPELLITTEEMFAAARTKFPDVVGDTFFVGDVLRDVHREFHEGDPAFDRIGDDAATNAELLFASSMGASPGYFSGLVDHERRRMKGFFFFSQHDIGAVERVYHSMDSWARNHFPPSVRVSFGGPAMLWVAQTKYVVEGKIQNVLWSMVTVWAFAIIIFGLVVGTLVAVPLVVATATTFGLMGWIGIHLNTATAIVTSMAVSFAVDAAFHFYHYFTSAKFPKSGNPLEGRMSYAVLWSGRAIVVDTAVNAAGFLVFLVSDFSPVRNFGCLVAFAIVITCAAIPLSLALYTIVRGRREERAWLAAQKAQQKTARESGNTTQPV